MRCLVLVSVACLSTAMVAQEPPEVPRDVVSAFHAALARGDSAGALARLAPDVLIFESGGAELSRAEYASHHLGADMAFAQAVTREVVETTSDESGDVAWVLTRTRITGTFRDRAVSLAGTETMLLESTADGWKIVHIHWSSRRVESPGGS